MRTKNLVANINFEKFDVKIDRTTKWGNPFKIGKDGTRDEVIELYANWILDQADLLNDLPELRGKTLGCWCWPQQCHGDVLVAILSLYSDDELRARKA